MGAVEKGHEEGGQRTEKQDKPDKAGRARCSQQTSWLIRLKVQMQLVPVLHQTPAALTALLYSLMKINLSKFSTSGKRSFRYPPNTMLSPLPGDDSVMTELGFRIWLAWRKLALLFFLEYRL